MLLDVDKSATTLHNSKALTILRTFINRVGLKTESVQILTCCLCQRTRNFNGHVFLDNSSPVI